MEAGVLLTSKIKSGPRCSKPSIHIEMIKKKKGAPMKEWMIAKWTNGKARTYSRCPIHSPILLFFKIIFISVTCNIWNKDESITNQLTKPLSSKGKPIQSWNRAKKQDVVLVKIKTLFMKKVTKMAMFGKLRTKYSEEFYLQSDASSAADLFSINMPFKKVEKKKSSKGNEQGGNIGLPWTLTKW